MTFGWKKNIIIFYVFMRRIRIIDLLFINITINVFFFFFYIPEKTKSFIHELLKIKRLDWIIWLCCDISSFIYTFSGHDWLSDTSNLTAHQMRQVRLSLNWISRKEIYFQHINICFWIVFIFFVVSKIINFIAKNVVDFAKCVNWFDYYYHVYINIVIHEHNMLVSFYCLTVIFLKITLI